MKDLLGLFKDRLLSGEGGDKIAHIILLGAYAKGTVGPDADIDILITTLDGREVEKALWTAGLRFPGPASGPIEIVFSPVYDLFPPQDCFYNVVRYRMEVYSADDGGGPGGAWRRGIWNRPTRLWNGAGFVWR